MPFTYFPSSFPSDHLTVTLVNLSLKQHLKAIEFSVAFYKWRNSLLFLFSLNLPCTMLVVGSDLSMAIKDYQLDYYY